MMQTEKNNVENKNKNSKVDLTFGFSDEELQMMYMHYNGVKISLQTEVYKDRDGKKRWKHVLPPFGEFVGRKDSFLSAMEESYNLNGYTFDWDAFKGKILGMSQDEFIKLFKILLIEWVDFEDILFCFYTFGVDVDEFKERMNEELNDSMNK